MLDIPVKKFSSISPKPPFCAKSAKKRKQMSDCVQIHVREDVRNESVPVAVFSFDTTTMSDDTIRAVTATAVNRLQCKLLSSVPSRKLDVTSVTTNLVAGTAITSCDILSA